MKTYWIIRYQLFDEDPHTSDGPIKALVEAMEPEEALKKLKKNGGLITVISMERVSYDEVVA